MKSNQNLKIMIFLIKLSLIYKYTLKLLLAEFFFLADVNTCKTKSKSVEYK